MADRRSALSSPCKMASATAGSCCSASLLMCADGNIRVRITPPGSAATEVDDPRLLTLQHRRRVTTPPLWAAVSPISSAVRLATASAAVSNTASALCTYLLVIVWRLCPISAAMVGSGISEVSGKAGEAVPQHMGRHIGRQAGHRHDPTNKLLESSHQPIAAGSRKYERVVRAAWRGTHHLAGGV